MSPKPTGASAGRCTRGPGEPWSGTTAGRSEGGLPAGRPRLGRGGGAADERRRSDGLFRNLCGELLADVAGVELPADPVPAASPPAVDAKRYTGRYERAGTSIEVVSRDGSLVAILTVTGLGSEMAPEPVELGLVPLDTEREVFLTQHPALKGAWLPARFTTLEDGRRCLHIGGRATPRAD